MPTTKISARAADDPFVSNPVSHRGAAGCLTHEWIPLLDGERTSVSAPSSICLTFNRVGRCSVSIGGKRINRDVDAGCVSVSGPEPIEWLLSASRADVIEIAPAEAVRREIADRLGIPRSADLQDLHGGSDCVVWAIAVRLRSLLRRPQPVPSHSADALIYELIAHILTTRFHGHMARKGDGKLRPRRLARVLEYIEAHLQDGALTLEAMAHAASLSPFHFLRSFQRTMHMTPHAFVRARRLQRASEDLACGDAVDLVAPRYGFNHARHFRAAYALHHGTAPPLMCGDSPPKI